MKMKKLFLTIAVSAALSMTQGANAALVNSDFLTAGDDYLVTDTTTDLEWLTPFYTKNHSYNDSFVQGLITNYGFRYATVQETSAMITLNFNNPPTVYPGNAAGYASALQFLDVFGINQPVSCVFGPCPRTEGLTSTSDAAGKHTTVGMILGELNKGGYMYTWSASDTGQYMSLGSWLVRPAEEEPAQVPTPPTLWLTILGLAGLVSFRKKLG